MKDATKITVRYNETDNMGYVYHSNYAVYYHISRTELLRTVGLDEKRLEINGVILPVIDLQAKFLKPAYYDDELIIETSLTKIKSCRLFFNHMIYNNGNMINEGSSIVAYVNKSTRKPIRIPEQIINKLKYLIN